MSEEPRRQLKLRVKLCSFAALGPGKADLLEAVDTTGSISAAARHLGMSYRRAWVLLDEMNRAFRAPVVDTCFGGAQGGGARLSDLGRTVLDTYRQGLRKAEAAMQDELDLISSLLADDLQQREAAAAAAKQGQRNSPPADA